MGTLVCQLQYADETRRELRAKSDASGRFELNDHLPPGVLRMKVQTDPPVLSGATAEPAEVKPGDTKDFGNIVMAAVKYQTITGRLLPSATFADLKGFKIRVDLDAWEPMVDTDADGAFTIPNVSEGPHRLTAYLPFNLRTDRGVGHADIEVGENRDYFELRLETLAVVHMQIQDESGKPLEGISAAAWWTPDHSGVFTEGTKSERQGKANLYLYPGELQYVGAYDPSDAYTVAAHSEMTLEPGEVVNDFRVVMKPSP